MKIGVCLPYMKRGLSRQTFKDWCGIIDQGPFHSLSCGERITGYSMEMRNILAFAAASTERVRIIPGISAVQYLCAKAGIDMNDIWLTSSHGRDVCFDELARQRKVAMVTDGRCGPRQSIGLPIPATPPRSNRPSTD